MMKTNTLQHEPANETGTTHANSPVKQMLCHI